MHLFTYLRGYFIILHNYYIVQFSLSLKVFAFFSPYNQAPPGIFYETFTLPAYSVHYGGIILLMYGLLAGFYNPSAK